jgi:beta-mannosidase
MLRAHQKHPTGFETITSYMQRDYPLAKNPEEYIYLSQLVQAKGIKMAVESYRAAKPYCMGSLYWQLNDCWPSISWSSIDFYQRKKALHYQLKNSYAPQLLVVNLVNDSFEVQLISDDLNARSGTLQLMLWSTNGQILDQQLLGVNIPANSNTKYRFALNPNLNWQEKNQWVLQANLLEQYDIIATQSFLFVSPKVLQLPEPKIEIEILPNNQISLLSRHLVKDVYIHFNNPAIEVSHNYFDLLPYQKVFFQVKNKENTSEIIKELDIKIQSLNLLKK